MAPRRRTSRGNAGATMLAVSGPPGVLQACPGPRPTQHFSIASGRDALGTIDLVVGWYIARDLDGKIIGRFPTLKASVASFDGAP